MPLSCLLRFELEQPHVAGWGQEWGQKTPFGDSISRYQPVVVLPEIPVNTGFAGVVLSVRI